jgi:hypothetical protein
MGKIAIGFFLGLAVASAIAQSVPDFDTRGIIIATQNKVNAHLDDEELKAIKEACK